MDAQYLGNGFLLLIKLNYPGGNEQFIKDGGHFMVMPNEDGLIFYHLLEVPARFQEAVNVVNSTRDVHIERVDSINPEILRGDLYNLLQEISKDHKMSFILSADNRISFRMAVAQELEEKTLKSIERIILNRRPDIVRGMIAHGEDELYLFTNKAYYRAAAESTEQRDTSIINDDLVNLRIDLEGDVSDIINRL